MFPICLFSQTCLPSGITFATQQDIDDFATNYSGCTQILGAVTIDGVTNSEITNLNGLSLLTSINGKLSIRYNDDMLSLSGLENITYVGGLTIYDNDAIINLSELANLTLIDGHMEIWRNDALTSLSGLDDLTTIDGKLIIQLNTVLSSLVGLESLTLIDGEMNIGNNNVLSNLAGLVNLNSIDGTLKILNNDALTSLSGLENLNSINGYIQIGNNDILTSLMGIQNIDPNTIESFSSAGNDLTISSNPLLSVCDVESICGFLDLAIVDPTLTAFIAGNANGCASQAEVETACSILPVTWLDQPSIIERNVNNEIRWSVSQQINNYKFVVEFRDSNGDFRSIGEVRGHGTILHEEKYTFIHNNPSSGLNYYRIKQVDLGGNFSCSDIASIHNTSDISISVYPNPTSLDVIYVVIQEESVYTLHFPDGRIIKKGTLKTGENSIDLSFLRYGIYFLKTPFDTNKIVKL